MAVPPWGRPGSSRTPARWPAFCAWRAAVALASELSEIRYSVRPVSASSTCRDGLSAPMVTTCQARRVPPGDWKSTCFASSPLAGASERSPRSLRADPMAALALARSGPDSVAGADRPGTGEPRTLISRPSLATFAFRPLPNRLSPPAVCCPGQVVRAGDVDVVTAQAAGAQVGGGEPEHAGVGAHVAEGDVRWPRRALGPVRKPSTLATWRGVPVEGVDVQHALAAEGRAEARDVGPGGGLGLALGGRVAAGRACSAPGRRRRRRCLPCPDAVEARRWTGATTRPPASLLRPRRRRGRGPY